MKLPKAVEAMLGVAIFITPMAMAEMQKPADTSRTVAVAPVLKTWKAPSPLAFPGGSVQFTGDLAATDPTFNRTTASGTTGGVCGPLSGVGTAVFFDTYSITNSTAGTLNVSVRMTGVGGGLATFDTFVHVYSPTFNPLASTTNCLRDNDDGPGGIGSSEISGANAAPIPAGAAIVIVADSFSNGLVGAYGLCITDQAVACTQPVELQHFRVD